MKSFRELIIFIAFSTFIFTGCLKNVPSDLSGTSQNSSTLTFSGVDSVSNLNDTRVKVKWTPIASSSVANYRIFLVNSQGQYVSVATVSSTFSSYIVSNLEAGSLYSFAVRLIDKSGLEDSNTNVKSTITFLGATGVNNIGATSADLLFPSAAQADSFNIYCARDSSTGTYSLMGQADSTQTSFSLTGLETYKNYYCKVKALIPNGEEDSNQKTIGFMTGMAEGADLQFAGIKSAETLSSGNQVKVTWDLGTGTAISNYRIYELEADGSTLTPLTTVSSTITTYTLTGVQPNSVHQYIVNAISATGKRDGNLIVKTVFPYSGLTNLVGQSTTSLTAVFPATGTGAEGVNIYCKIFSDINFPSLPTLVVSSSTSTSASITGLNAGTTYDCKARPFLNDEIFENPSTLSANTNYPSVVASTQLSTTSLKIDFTPVSSLRNGTGVSVFCKKASEVFSTTPTATLNSNTTADYTLFSLASGRSYDCKVVPIVSGVMMDINSVPSKRLQTMRRSNLAADLYNGVMLVKAFGDAPNAPVGTPTQKAITINWNYFGTDQYKTYTYYLVRSPKGEALDMQVTTACTPTSSGACRVCTITGVGPQSCVDNQIADMPAQYDYAMTIPSTDGAPEDLPLENESSYRIFAAVPPTNMVLIQRDSVNYEMCKTMKKASDPLNKQRCSYSGLGAVPYNAGIDLQPLNLPTTFFDFGYDLFIDRWEAGCNWNHAGTDPATVTGNLFDVYYKTTTGECLVRMPNPTTGILEWRRPAETDYDLPNATPTISDTFLARLMTNAPSAPASSSKIPPLVRFSARTASRMCSTAEMAPYGKKRLLRRREFIAAAPMATFSGEAGRWSVADAKTIEGGGDYTGTTAPYYRCNQAAGATFHPGVTASVFNNGDPNYELSLTSPSSASTPESFVLGSKATQNCVSRFGAQDMMGNVAEWTSSQLKDCQSSTLVCEGADVSSLDSGDRDLAGFRFDGLQGLGGSLAGTVLNTHLSYEYWNGWGVGSALKYFSVPLGLPLLSNDNGQAIRVEVSPALIDLQGDYINLSNNQSGKNGQVRSISAGGHWYEARAGRWSVDMFRTEKEGGETSSSGFRCALPVQ